MYYHATPTVRDNLLVLVSQAQVKGVDAVKIVKLAASFKEPVKEADCEPDYYLVDDDLIKFAIDVVNNSNIRGNTALAVVSILDMLHKPVEKVPVALTPQSIAASMPASAERSKKPAPKKS